MVDVFKRLGKFCSSRSLIKQLHNPVHQLAPIAVIVDLSHAIMINNASTTDDCDGF